MFFFVGVDDAYGMAIECVYSLVEGSAASGSMFDYQSEKRQKYAITYNSVYIPDAYGPIYDKHTAKVSLKNNILTISFSRNSSYGIINKDSAHNWVWLEDINALNLKVDSFKECMFNE